MSDYLRHEDPITPADYDEDTYVEETDWDGSYDWREQERGDANEADPDYEECEHGLAAWLCVGPGHYPADNTYA